MYNKKYNMSVLIFIAFVFFFCGSARLSWAKDYSSNVHWVFCVDTSGSMKARGKVDLLKLITEKITNEFINLKKDIIEPGDRITLFSFDEDVRLEATTLYQTKNDLTMIRERLREMNMRVGQLTFTSEAIVQAIDFMNKYNNFFQTNALYVFTDGKSEPYSKKWTDKRIEKRKKRDLENFKKISLFGKDYGMNVWLGILKWEAFNDAKELVKKMGKGGHIVDLTDFNRLSLEKALENFAQTVRSSVTVSDVDDLYFGTIPYKNNRPYLKKIVFPLQTDTGSEPPPIRGHIKFEPDNPSEISQEYPVEIKTTEDKMVLNFTIQDSDKLKPGLYKGKLELMPSMTHFGALIINPSKINVSFKKSGLLGFYFWKVVVGCGLGFMFFLLLVNTIKRKMPIRV